jgi:hypothetical protein
MEGGLESNSNTKELAKFLEKTLKTLMSNLSGCIEGYII